MFVVINARESRRILIHHAASPLIPSAACNIKNYPQPQEESCKRWLNSKESQAGLQEHTGATEMLNPQKTREKFLQQALNNPLITLLTS